ncbi:hypothetical protein BSLG_001989 [Batrachochytrium salamandrivorans]|nr:hypothetical protein BSLG_001989 [Batrachochytrium salamandrivorans]
MGLGEAASKRKSDWLHSRSGAAGVPLLRFRNYQPDAETLQDFVEPAPLIGPDASGHVDTVEGQAIGTLHGRLHLNCGFSLPVTTNLDSLVHIHSLSDLG